MENQGLINLKEKFVGKIANEKKAIAHYKDEISQKLNSGDWNNISTWDVRQSAASLAESMNRLDDNQRTLNDIMCEINDISTKQANKKNKEHNGLVWTESNSHPGNTIDLVLDRDLKSTLISRNDYGRVTQRNQENVFFAVVPAFFMHDDPSVVGNQDVTLGEFSTQKEAIDAIEKEIPNQI